MEENTATARPRYPAHVTGVTSGILLVMASAGVTGSPACLFNFCKLRVAPVGKHPAQQLNLEFNNPGHLAAAEPHLSSSDTNAASLCSRYNQRWPRCCSI